jgi:hypothetical protein
MMKELAQAFSQKLRKPVDVLRFRPELFCYPNGRLVRSWGHGVAKYARCTGIDKALDTGGYRLLQENASAGNIRIDKVLE